MNDPKTKPSIAQRYIDVCDERDQINGNYQAEIADHHETISELHRAKNGRALIEEANVVLIKQVEQMRLEDLERAKSKCQPRGGFPTEYGTPGAWDDAVREMREGFARERADLNHEQEERFGKATTTPTFGPHYLRTIKSPYTRSDMPVDDLSFGEAVQCRGEWLSLFVKAEPESDKRHYWRRQIVLLEDRMMSKGHLRFSRTSFHMYGDTAGDADATERPKPDSVEQ